jgi:hypothetical protein
MQLTKGWIQIELIEKSQFNKEPIQGKGKTDTDVVYFSGLHTPVDGKYFIKEEQIIAYE